MPIESTNNKRMHEKEMLVLDYTRDKLEDMDVSLKMSASLKGPTLQT